MQVVAPIEPGHQQYSFQTDDAKVFQSENNSARAWLQGAVDVDRARRSRRVLHAGRASRPGVLRLRDVRRRRRGVRGDAAFSRHHAVQPERVPHHRGRAPLGPLPLPGHRVRSVRHRRSGIHVPTLASI